MGRSLRARRAEKRAQLMSATWFRSCQGRRRTGGRVCDAALAERRRTRVRVGWHPEGTEVRMRLRWWLAGAALVSMSLAAGCSSSSTAPSSTATTGSSPSGTNSSNPSASSNPSSTTVGSSPAAAAANVAVTDAIRAQLVAAAAGLNSIPVAEYTGLTPGLTYYALDTQTNTYWAGAKLQ